MNHQYALPRENCTFKNAMLWGNFRGHCNTLKSGELSTKAKCFHITMAVLETLPILSQLISVIEFVANNIFYFF